MSTHARLPRSEARPSAKTTADLGTLVPIFVDKSPAATGRSRSRSVTQASRTAAPFRSAPDDAAVAEVFGTLSVVVAITRTRSAGRPSSRIATPWIFVCSPWPISVPPWFTCAVPSV